MKKLIGRSTRVRGFLYRYKNNLVMDPYFRTKKKIQRVVDDFMEVYNAVQ